VRILKLIKILRSKELRREVEEVVRESVERIRPLLPWLIATGNVADAMLAEWLSRQLELETDGERRLRMKIREMLDER